MDTISQTWLDLIGLSGILNPLALLIGGFMGWKADQPAKLAIAAFGGAVLSLFLEAGWLALGLPYPIPHDAGALAMIPFRFIGAGVVASVAYLLARRSGNS